MDSRIALYQGDITQIKADAIVNAANSSLMGGGGVDGAIHRAAGPELLEATQKLNGCPTGDAKITKGFKLPAKFIIHTVGPVWRGGSNGEEKLLASAYRRSMEVARINDVKTIAFPNISTGVYGFPKEKAADIALETIENMLKDDEHFERVIFALFDTANYTVYAQKLENA